jgi:hypothetical protein
MLTPREQLPREEELIAHVRAWLNLLADGRLTDACAQLDEPNTYGVSWTPAAIMRTLSDTYGSDSRFRREHPQGPAFSRVERATGEGRASVVAFEDGSGYSVEHDVPLNGAYSDLTVQLEFRWRGATLAFILHDLHVM